MSPRGQMFIIFVGTALALAIAAVVQSYWLLLVAAVISGVAQSISIPSTNRIITNAVPIEKQTIWLTIKQAGVQVFQFFSGLFFPIVALALGWTGAALGAAVLSGLLWIISLKYLPTTNMIRPTSKRPMAEPVGDPTKAAAVAADDKLPAVVYYFTFISMLAGLGMQATNVYLPLFAVEELDFSLMLGGVATAVAGVIGFISRMFWGRSMQAGIKPSLLLLLISTGAVLGALAFLGAAHWHQPLLFWFGTIFHGLTVFGITVVINAGLLRVVPGHKIGKASGLSSMGMYAGYALGPLIMGLLRDFTHSFTAGWIYVGVSYVLSGLVTFMLHRRPS